MNTNLLKTFFVALFLITVTGASAHDFYVDGIYYNITGATAKTVEVTYKGGSCSEYDNEYTGSVVIPSMVTYNNAAYSVTSIGSHAFWYCTGLTGVTIPNSVTTIGDFAFINCRGLTSVTIHNSVTTIGDGAFSGCSGLKEVHISDLAAWCKIDFGSSSSNPLYYAHNLYLNGEKVTNLVIPNSVTGIGNYAFYGCTGLTGVEIPNSVTSIGEDAFYNSGWYKNQNAGLLNLDGWLLGYKEVKPTGVLNLKKGERGIAVSAFKDCTELTGVVLGNSVTNIGDNAFYKCTGLTGVTIGNSVTSIGNSAFYKCDGLKEVHISDLAAWCGIDFTDVFSNPLDYAHNLYLNGEKVTNLVIPDGVTEIKGSAFSGCSGLTSITIPNSVTSIGNYAFDGCTGLTSVTIGNSVTSIGSGALGDCSGLKEVHISDLVAWYGIDFTDVSSNPLYYAHNLYLNGKKVTNLVIPDGVTEIKDYAFEYCSDLTGVTIPNSVTSIGKQAFYTCRGLTNITIPNSVTSIGSHAFSGCDGLISITIGNSVTSIGDGAFSWCTGLTSITIPNSVTSIGNSAFSWCTGLTGELTIPNSVTGIGNYAFRYCTGLTSVTIGNGVTSIGNNAFEGCTGLTAVHISDLAAWCGIDFEYNMGYYDSNFSSNPLYYAHNLYLNGKKVTNLVIPDGVTEIKDYTFYNCTGLTGITIPNSVTSIGSSAFTGCSALKEIYSLSETPATISSDTFSDYSAMLYVPLGAKGAYQAVAYWENFDNIVEFDVETGNVHYPLADWVSTNKYDNTTSSNTYSIVAVAGSVLSFDWQVSSESGYDWFIVTFDGAEIVKGAGEDSGRYTYKFEQAGTYDLTAKYVKDDGYSKGDDCGKIYNILLTSPTDIDEIEADDSFNGLRDTYYDLNGSVVENPTKGIYIYNGKKVLVQ